SGGNALGKSAGHGRGNRATENPAREEKRNISAPRKSKHETRRGCCCRRERCRRSSLIPSRRIDVHLVLQSWSGDRLGFGDKIQRSGIWEVFSWDVGCRHLSASLAVRSRIPQRCPFRRGRLQNNRCGKNGIQEMNG